MYQILYWINICQKGTLPKWRSQKISKLTISRGWSGSAQMVPELHRDAERKDSWASGVRSYMRRREQLGAKGSLHFIHTATPFFFFILDIHKGEDWHPMNIPAPLSLSLTCLVVKGTEKGWFLYVLLGCARVQLAEKVRIKRGGYSNIVTLKQKNSTLPWKAVKLLDNAAVVK